MKLATAKDGSRDGQLLVVSRDLSLAHYATGIANTLQQALDDWNFVSPQLQDLSDSLNQGKARHAFAFDPTRCMAPLPRAFQRASASAFVHHAELQHRAQGRDVPDDLRSQIQLTQSASDDFSGPCDDLHLANEDGGIDFGAELAVITGDIAAGSNAEQALDGIRLFLLANAVSLRERGASGASGPVSFSPVAVTRDELGAAWQQGRLHLALQSSVNGRKVGLGDVGPDMHFHFGELIAQLCQTRAVRAGSVVASGPVSHAGQDDKGRMHWPKGYHCVADKRAMETLQDGQPSTAYLKFGDSLRMEMKDKDGLSVFGAIEQKFAAAPARR